MSGVMAERVGDIPWGEDLERDCRELRKLESWGLYRHGYHDECCPLDHAAPTHPADADVVETAADERKS